MYPPLKLIFKVSIHSRRLGREIPAISADGFRRLFVSIHSRRLGREILPAVLFA